MLTVNSQGILSTGLPLDGREFTRYFSEFPVTSLDQQVIVYHKKNVHIKNWKDIGSGVDVFICREKISLEDLQDVANICQKFGQLMVRDEIIYGIQLHVPLTSDYLGKEDYFTQLVHDLWVKRYIIVQTIMDAKEYPFVQWSITDPALLEVLIPFMKGIENEDQTAIVSSILASERRAEIVEHLVQRCEEQ